MKCALPFLLISIFLATACSSTNKTTNTKQITDSSIKRDGLSFETAIIAKSVPDEYEWVSKNYPGAQRQTQSLAFEGGKPYDILTFILPDGTTQKFYFDISKFFGKGFK